MAPPKPPARSPATSLPEALPKSLRAVIGKRVAPPRFIAFLLLLPAGYFAWQWAFPSCSWTETASMAFDLAAGVFLLSLIPLLNQSKPDAIRRHADATDANRVLVLLVTSLLTVTVMITIVGELTEARHGNGWAMVRLVGTLLMVWLFANTVYALHYAHEYYGLHPETETDCGGLDFPGKGDPGYLDFVYFSFTLGMTFQTSDVAITTTRVRAIVLLHSFAAFVFNLGVIAFTINVLGGGSN